MCGHVGAFGSNLLAKHKDALTTLLYFDTLRGEDATGVAAVKQDRSCKIFKMAVPGHEYLQHHRYRDLTSYTDVAWIGHNRFGTIGGKTRANAHPFEVLDDEGDTVLVGAHNGTLKNRHQLPNGNKYGTDSEGLLNLISAVGPKEAIAQADGAWALVWFDMASDTLNFLRNKERELFFCYEKDKRNMFWASEEWMLRIALSRHRIEVDENKYFYFEPDKLYRFDAPVKINEVLDFKSEEGMVGKPATFFPAQTTGGAVPAIVQTHRQAIQTQTSSTVNLPTRTNENGAKLIGFTSLREETNKLQRIGSVEKSCKTGSSSNVHSLTAHRNSSETAMRGFRGHILTHNEAREILAQGCTWCELEELKLGDRYGWLDDTNVVCFGCLNDPDTPVHYSPEDDDDEYEDIVVYHPTDKDAPFEEDVDDDEQSDYDQFMGDYPSLIEILNERKKEAK